MPATRTSTDEVHRVPHEPVQPDHHEPLRWGPRRERAPADHVEVPHAPQKPASPKEASTASGAVTRATPGVAARDPERNEDPDDRGHRQECEHRPREHSNPPAARRQGAVHGSTGRYPAAIVAVHSVVDPVAADLARRGRRHLPPSSRNRTASRQNGSPGERSSPLCVACGCSTSRFGPGIASKRSRPCSAVTTSSRPATSRKTGAYGTRPDRGRARTDPGATPRAGTGSDGGRPQRARRRASRGGARGRPRPQRAARAATPLPRLSPTSQTGPPSRVERVHRVERRGGERLERGAPRPRAVARVLEERHLERRAARAPST